MTTEDKTPKDAFWLIALVSQIVIILQLIGVFFGLAALFYGDGFLILATSVGGILLAMIPWGIANIGTDNRKWRETQWQQLNEQTQLLKRDTAPAGNSGPSPRF